MRLWLRVGRVATAMVTGILFLIEVGSPVAADPVPSVADRCAPPPDLVATESAFPTLADRLRQKQPMVIVAIGGASTLGVGPMAQSYPARLEVELSRRYGASNIRVINLGVARETAIKMLRRLSDDVLPLKPQLVIWETGTNDAVFGVTLDDFAQALKDGLGLLKAAGIDVLLMDMQYSRGSAEVINFERYMETMLGVAEVGDTRLFRRYAMMKYWSESGVFDFDGPTAGATGTGGADL